MLMDSVAVIRLPEEWDSHAVSWSSFVVNVMQSLKGFTRTILKLSKSSPLVVVLELLLLYFLSPTIRFPALFWTKTIGKVYIALGSIAYAVKNEDFLWKTLNYFIQFAREQVGRDHGKNSQNWGVWSVFLRPNVIQCIFLGLLFIYAAGQHNMDEYFFQNVGFGNKRVESNGALHLAPVNSGFVARIDSCYDGDTCYLRDLSFDGVRLPPLFKSMKIRLRGIDAPERSRAQCSLERCLADLARDHLEEILQAGNGEYVSLKDCKHDKYGGRMLCSVAGSRGDASSQMIDSGFAIPYHGRTKTSPWCQKNFLRKSNITKDLALYCEGAAINALTPSISRSSIQNI